MSSDRCGGCVSLAGADAAASATAVALACLEPSSASEARAGEERARVALRAMQDEHASRRMGARARGEAWEPEVEAVRVAGELRHERERLRALARRLERIERASGGAS